MKVLSIGLDGASFELIQQFIGEGILPTFEQLALEGIFYPLPSTTPPHTAPGWVTSLTGVNPGKHGIYQFWETQAQNYAGEFMGSNDVEVPFIWDLLGEYGRSKGRMTEKLAKKLAVHNTICEQTQEIKSLKDSFAVIFMMNTVHYLSAEAFSKRITEMKQLLKKDGLLCIADVFYQDDTMFHSTVLLDWLTHGGIHHLFLNETCKELRACGYGEIRHQFIENIFTHLIYAYPSGASEQGATLC